MFEPTIDKKQDINKELLNDLKYLKNKKENLENKIDCIKKENLKIEEKINILELLLTEQSQQ
jgi:predicted nuclease with TOPRIM domain